MHMHVRGDTHPGKYEWWCMYVLNDSVSLCDLHEIHFIVASTRPTSIVCSSVCCDRNWNSCEKREGISNIRHQGWGDGGGGQRP